MMAKECFPNVSSLCGLLQKQISFKSEFENDSVERDDRRPLKELHDSQDIRTLGYSASTYKMQEEKKDGQTGLNVGVKGDSVTDGHRVKKGGWLSSRNGNRFSAIEDLMKFFTSPTNRQLGSSITLGIKQGMKTTDSTSKSGQSSEYGIVVVCNSKTDDIHTDHTVSVVTHTDLTCQMNSCFEPQSVERFYFKWIVNNSYVMVRKKKLMLRSRVRRRNKNRAIFKLHSLQENFHCTDSAIAVVLEHEKSGLWVSLTKSGVTMKPPQDLGQMSRDNSCLLKMVREGHGMTYMFKSYHLREAGQVVFLGFQPDNRSVVPVQGTLGKGQPDKGPENATFLLFTAP